MKRSEHDASLLASMGSELGIMNEVHDIMKRSEHDASLLSET